MKKGKKAIYAAQAMVLVLACCLMFGCALTDVTAKSKETTAIKKVSLTIGNQAVTQKTYEMKVGEKKTVKVSVSPKNLKQTVSYATDNKKIASVSKSGTITAKKAGSTKVKVTVKAGKEKKATWVKIKVAKASSAQPTPEASKSLVAYFSCTDTTKEIAEQVKEIMDADIYRIEAAQAYTAADLNYNNASSRTTKEQGDAAVRPAISGSISDISKYDVIFLGYPIWHGQAPRIISSFLESYDFSGKTIVPFCTSHSSGIGSSASNLHSLVDSSVKWMDGKRFAAGASKEKIKDWLKEMGMGNSVAHAFDFKTKTVLLNSGYEMPIYGIGTYSLMDKVCVDSVTAALNSGVRLIDTAYMYQNEESVGRLSEIRAFLGRIFL